MRSVNADGTLIHQTVVQLLKTTTMILVWFRTEYFFGIPLQISLLVSLPVAIRVLRGPYYCSVALTTLSVVK